MNTNENETEREREKDPQNKSFRTIGIPREKQKQKLVCPPIEHIFIISIIVILCS